MIWTWQTRAHTHNRQAESNLPGDGGGGGQSQNSRVAKCQNWPLYPPGTLKGPWVWIGGRGGWAVWVFQVQVWTEIAGASRVMVMSSIITSAKRRCLFSCQGFENNRHYNSDKETPSGHINTDNVQWMYTFKSSAHAAKDYSTLSLLVTRPWKCQAERSNLQSWR